MPTVESTITVSMPDETATFGEVEKRGLGRYTCPLDEVLALRRR